ncbi:MAG: hypothetical protein VW338_14895 [Rhodospirillaceae bacterium]
MWIASKIGFFSIVQKDAQTHIRARVKKDLENLIEEIGIEGWSEEDLTIQEWPGADYRFRLRIHPDDLGVLFQKLAETIDYPNFKNEIHRRPDQAAKSPAYTTLWGHLHSLQERDQILPVDYQCYDLGVGRLG